MEKILEALKELGVGRYDMYALAEKMDGGATPQGLGRIVHRLNGVVIDGMRIKIENAGRKLYISLHNSVYYGSGGGYPTGGPDVKTAEFRSASHWLSACCGFRSG